MNTFLQILQALPAIIAAIKAVEQAVPGSGQGSAKLDAVLGIVTAAEAGFSQCLPQLTTIVGVLVGLFNKTGVFAAKPA